jgi:hypothetical protein
MHSYDMEGKILLAALLKEADLNANSLAKILKNQKLQTQMHRFITGETKNPRWSSLKPIADFFEIRLEAFFDPKVANQIAIEKGFIKINENKLIDCDSIVSNKINTINQKKLDNDLFEILIALGEILKPCDNSAKKAVASLLSDLALNPDEAKTTALHITRLLDIKKR